MTSSWKHFTSPENRFVLEIIKFLLLSKSKTTWRKDKPSINIENNDYVEVILFKVDATSVGWVGMKALPIQIKQFKILTLSLGSFSLYLLQVACRATCNKKALAHQVSPLAPGYRTALSLCPAGWILAKFVSIKTHKKERGQYPAILTNKLGQ